MLLRRRSLRMPDDDITTVSGLPVTTVLRTVLDCAFDVPPSESICIADSALRALVRPTRDQRTASEHRAATIRRRLQDELEAMAGRSGARRARAVIAIASPFAESPGESIMRCFVTALGLPAPVLQPGVEDGIEVVVYFPDLAWPALKIYLEFDGRLKYESDADLWREKKRRDALARLGWRGEHVTWDDLRNPARLCAKILALFPPEIVHPGPTGARVVGLRPMTVCAPVSSRSASSRVVVPGSARSYLRSLLRYDRVELGTTACAGGTTAWS